jgi:hypothetical protein
VRTSSCKLRAVYYLTIIEELYSVSNTEKDKAVVNQIAGALVARILKAAKKGEKFKVIPSYLYYKTLAD